MAKWQNGNDKNISSKGKGTKNGHNEGLRNSAYTKNKSEE